MNKRQTRLFAIVSTAIASLVFLGLTLDSHRQFPTLTHADQLTPEVVAGKDVWHKYNCVNCHTLFGEGAYYAPDLTKIAKLRGEQYLTAYMKNPAQFYDEQRHRRLMPKQDLSDEEIRHLISFLGWVSNVDNGGWPPRPILVTGATIPGTDMSAQQGQALPVRRRRTGAASRPAGLGATRTRWPSASACFARRRPPATRVTRWHKASTWPGPHWPASARGRPRPSLRPSTRARPRMRRAMSASPSSNRVPTWSPGRCIRRTPFPSCPTPMARA